MNPSKFPELKTERLTLRKLKEADRDVILYLRSDKIINTLIKRPPERQTKNVEDAIAHIQKATIDLENNKSVTWGISVHNNPNIIGTICLWNFSEDKKTAEVGYDLSLAFQNKGIMNEALQSVLDFGFTVLKFNLIEAFTHTKNENSKKLLLKNGFHLNAKRKDNGNLANTIFEIRNPNL